MADTLDEDLKKNYLKDACRTKGRCEDSKNKTKQKKTIMCEQRKISIKRKKT